MPKSCVGCVIEGTRIYGCGQEIDDAVRFKAPGLCIPCWCEWVGSTPDNPENITKTKRQLKTIRGRKRYEHTKRKIKQNPDNEIEILGSRFPNHLVKRIQRLKERGIIKRPRDIRVMFPFLDAATISVLFHATPKVWASWSSVNKERKEKRIKKFLEGLKNDQSP